MLCYLIILMCDLAFWMISTYLCSGRNDISFPTDPRGCLSSAWMAYSEWQMTIYCRHLCNRRDTGQQDIASDIKGITDVRNAVCTRWTLFLVLERRHFQREISLVWLLSTMSVCDFTISRWQSSTQTFNLGHLCLDVSFTLGVSANQDVDLLVPCNDIIIVNL